MRWGLPSLLLGVAIAFVLRVGDLSLRPLHNDEAINAFKLQKLWSEGVYRYDPHEYHGPVLYYASLPVLTVSRWFRPDQPDETAMRSVAVVAGVLLVASLGLAARWIGWGVASLAALWIALSPVMTFYSRYYIHELWLVWFTFLAVIAGGRYFERPSPGPALLAGLALGCAYATKETFVFAVAAAAGAWVLVAARPSATAAADRPEGGLGRVLRWWRPALEGARWTHLLWAALGFVGASAVWFTSFFAHPGGLLDAAKTYLIWFERAGGASPHIHPWSFYLERLAWFQVRGGPLWTEAALLALAVAGAVSLWRSPRWTETQRRAGRWASLASLLLLGVYCLIPYKTPWCLLGFYHGLLVTAGFGAWALVTWSRRWWVRGVWVAVLATAAVHLVIQSRRANLDYPADFRNPWVYGHTAQDITNLLELVEALAAVHPDGRRMPLQVIAPESQYWPLPWYWRRFEQVGWWDALPENPFTPVVVCSTKLQANLEERSRQAWRQAGMFELRPRFFVEVYVEDGLWRRLLAARAAERGP